LGTTTKIEWADATANFWLGCSRVAYGCTNCYAEAFARRVGADVWGKDKPRRYVKGVYADLRNLNREAIDSGTRPRVFVSSLCDFFDDSDLQIDDSDLQIDDSDLQIDDSDLQIDDSDLQIVDTLGRPMMHGKGLTIKGDGYIVSTGDPEHAGPLGPPVLVEDLRQRAWELIRECTSLDFMILTKRPEAVRSLWPIERDNFGCWDPLPLENVWLGVSAATDGEYVQAFKQLHALRDLARFTFVSAEPMIEDIRPRLGGFAGVGAPDLEIIGGESGPAARPCRIEWVRNFVRARRQHPEGARIFIKQLGARVPDAIVALEDRKGGNIDEWPPDVRIRELPLGAFGA
jgi:protein gp37